MMKVNYYFLNTNNTMKKMVLYSVIVFFSILLMSFISISNSAITGKWIFSNSKRQIIIYEDKNVFFGKIIEVSGEDKDEKKGHILLKDFIYDNQKNLFKGQMIAPSGMKANGELRLINNNEIELVVKKMLFSKTIILKKISK
ncbi:MAG: hypothetical protein JNJ52_08820 [Flavobacterium sp.]|nr:hypothetical protein [Flavobacterium sp.]